MDCKSCGNKFKMYEIPVDERIYGPFSAIFSCPHCAVLLQADKKIRILSMIGIILFGFSFLAIFLNKIEILDVNLKLSLTGLILGCICFFVSLINTQTEIVEGIQLE